MASIEQDEGEEIDLEADRIIMGEEMEVLDEIGEEEAERGTVSDPKAGQCILCSDKARHPIRHALEKHLPWYYNPQTACWICKKQEVREARVQYHAKEHHGVEEQFHWNEVEYGESWVQLMNGLFRELASVFKVDYPEGLVKHVNEILEGVKTPKNLTVEELLLVTLFNRVNEYPVFEGKKLKSKSIYQLHSLIHWKVLTVIFSKLDIDQQQWLKSFEEYKSVTGLSLGPLGVKLSGTIPIADSHFHMDTLMTRTGCSGFHELSDYGTREFYKTSLKFMVANYCFPSSWPSSPQRTELRKTPSIYFSFGIHPRIVNFSSPSNLQQNITDLEHLLKSFRTVAIGECGLDTSGRNTHLDKQIEYLEKQLHLAVSRKLPVVIHCRGDESLHRILLTSLTNCCPTQQHIHWHCFTSTQGIYQSAADHFPNLVFGVTPFIFGTRYPNITELIKRNGIDRIVLETDAPYINYRDNQISNPYVINFIMFIADEISKLLNIPVEQIFSTTFSNTQKIYGRRD